MRACFREGVVSLLQMHDSLDLSVSSPKQAEMVARLGEEVIKLEVPMKIDVTFGHSWGDAKHTWAELYAETGYHVELEMFDAPERTPCESPKFFNDSDRLPWEEDSEITDSAADDGAIDENHSTELEPAPIIIELPHICIHCRRDPPDGLECVSAYDGAYLHPACEEPFIRARMAQEGIVWQSAGFAQAMPPPTSPPSPPPSSPSLRGSGNGYDTSAAAPSSCAFQDVTW
jgi:hypothetical protein